MVPFVLCVLGLCVLPTLALAFVEHRWRPRWVVDRIDLVGQTRVGGGAFRSAMLAAEERRVVRKEAPFSFRAVAWMSFFFGQMLLPGVFAWGVGLFLLGEASTHSERWAPFWLMWLSGPFGMVTAVLAWGAGLGLLRGDRATAERRVRRAVAWEVGLNVVLLVGSIVMAALNVRESEFLMLSAGCSVLSLLYAGTMATVFRIRREEIPEAPTVDDETTASE